MPGFKTQTVTGLRLEIQQKARLNFRLEVGELSERQWAVHWRLAHPTAALDTAVEALQAEFPGRVKQTYYNWAHAAAPV